MAILNGLKLKETFFYRIDTQKNRVFRVRIEYDTRKNRVFQVRIEYDTRKKSSISGLGWVSSSILDTHSKT